MARARPSAAGGFPVAIGSILGFVVGSQYDQASAGFMIGFSTGVAIAVAIWLWDRHRV